MPLGPPPVEHRPAITPAGYPHVFAERLRPALQDRTLGGMVRLPGRTWQVILLTDGRAETLHSATDDRADATSRVPQPRAITAPALVWWPAAPGLRFRLRAGSAGGHLVVDDTALAGAIGVRPEAEDLRLLVQRPTILPLDEAPGARTTAAAAFDLILAETTTPARGADLVIEAQLRVLLVLLWRHSALPPGTSPATATRLLQAFRQSVEAHFRDRWTVADHARALGLTPDRLHDLCTRTLGKPPQRLIHERLAHEARLMLARSSATLDQIAGTLGFTQPGHFNRFFRGIEGVPPGVWRRAQSAGRPGQAQGAEPSTSYADWP
ncbi:MAG: AraC family transcriptional regulator [Rhodobacteraceae bacterium]|nr:AraC family transcriptional regulator [Paracoccaceae bacterium]